MSVLPVWRPERDQVVSPWRIMKTRGVVISFLVVLSIYCISLEGFLFFSLGFLFASVQVQVVVVMVVGRNLVRGMTALERGDSVR